MSNEKLQAFVEKIASTPQRELARELRGEPAPVPTAPKPKKKRGRQLEMARKTGLALELSRFLKAHDMNFVEFGEIADFSPNYIRLMAGRGHKPSADTVAHMRKVMSEYEAGLKTTKQFVPTIGARPDKLQIGDSITTLGLDAATTNALVSARIKTIGDLLALNYVDLAKTKGMGKTRRQRITDALSKNGLALKKLFPAEPFAPTRPVPPRAAPAPVPPPPVPPPAPKQATIDLVVDNAASVRLNNGENIAPHLKLDGKTMHVFTLVPGGVFISYVEARVENR